VHHVARDEDDGTGAGRRGLITDGQFISALEDEEDLFLAEMDVVGRAFAGFVSPHEDRNGAVGGLGREEDSQVEAEGLERQCLFGLDDGSLQRSASSVHVVSSLWGE